ncbi:MAG: LysR family transcriptional regulator [Hyphomicrobiales bacterium]|nr:LysR family transcriptional regulator [Hyphomicrobiales bacterium]PCJ88455.1 MAG: LysR family transcriptional regulator [Hyphomicrobiales bacterium]
MRYVQLRAFHYVAIHGGFSRAAEVLHLTQPAISDQVRKLESEYDVRLFDRHRKQVTVTAAGLKLLELTRRMFDIEQQAHELLTESRALKVGRLNIMADSALHMLHILGPFRASYPDIFVSIGVGNTQAVINALHSYEADIGVLGELPTSRDFEIVHLNSTPIVAFAPVGSEYAQNPSITIRELAAMPLVMREQGSRTRYKLEEFARSQNIDLRVQIEAEGRETVREIVASGAGVGVVSEAEFGEDRRLTKLTISDANITMDEALICLRERFDSKLIRTFMPFAKAAAKV